MLLEGGHRLVTSNAILADVVVLDPQYWAPLRDVTDLDALQTAERGEADVLCIHDDDFSDPVVLSYCTARGIEVCDEFALLDRLARDTQQ